MPKEVDLLHPRFDVKWIVGFVLIVALVLILWGVSNWIKNFITGLAKPLTGKAEEPTI